MVVTKNNVISIYYSVIDMDGNEIDSNKEFEPLQYLHGGENIMPSLEAALEGAVINEERKITLEPHQAYGDYNDQLVVSVDKEKFPANLGHPEKGMIVDINEGGEMMVVALEGNKVILDGNHPLAGKTLHYPKLEMFLDWSEIQRKSIFIKICNLLGEKNKDVFAVRFYHCNN